MKPVKKVVYLRGYKLRLTFSDRAVKVVDLERYLDGEVFKPLKKIDYFKTVRVNPDIDTFPFNCRPGNNGNRCCCSCSMCPRGDIRY